MRELRRFGHAWHCHACAYPSIPAPPLALAGSAAGPMSLDASLITQESVRATATLIRQKSVRVIHFISHPAWSFHYPRLHRVGVGRIIVYDHESGEYMRPTGLKRVVKWGHVRTPGLAADVVLAVSDFEAQRQVDVGLVPRERVITLWNGIPVVPMQGAATRVQEICGVSPGRPVIVCNCRAAPEKGEHHLLSLVKRCADSDRAVVT